MTYELHGVRVLECSAEGAELRNDRDAIEMIASAWEHRASLLVIPAQRLADDFFRLRTGAAGAIIQKFVNYRLRVAIAGDVSRYVSESSAFRDFVVEANRGDQVWFVANIEELGRRLDPASC
jgi:archaeosine-15-forming tRNA-guanine transglycosylase